MVARSEPLAIRGLVRDWRLMKLALKSGTAFAQRLAKTDNGAEPAVVDGYAALYHCQLAFSVLPVDQRAAQSAGLLGDNQSVVRNFEARRGVLGPLRAETIEQLKQGPR